MLKIPKQTAAEADAFLSECFEESTFISDLISNNFSLVLGRKGSGKTALAKYLQSNHFKHSISFSHRISITELSNSSEKNSNPVELTIFFILTRTIQLFIEKKFFDKSYINYWKDFLLTNGLQDISDYQAFFEWSKTNEAKASLKLLDTGADGSFTKQYQRTPISNSTASLFQYFKKSLLKTTNKIIIFIDDISDYIDRIDSQDVQKDIAVIRDVLLRLDNFNSSLVESFINLSFVSCVRDDLFENMRGSNINKLENSALELKWTEESFCRLLIRRLPFYSSNIETALESATQSINEFFPSKIFNKRLEESQTKSYQTGFYAYMMSISFNRPRDFLKFCFCMRIRLSEHTPVTFPNIESAEIEYTDYLFKELKDELELTSMLKDRNTPNNDIKKLLKPLSLNDDFSYGQLRTNIASFLGKGSQKNSNSASGNFIKELWNYGILGFRNPNNNIATFKYFGFSSTLFDESNIKSYKYMLHRGIKWALRK